jgi:outer membrane receptor for ferrienterochelin and colicins
MKIFLLLFCLYAGSVYSQKNIRFFLSDSLTGEPLSNVSAALNNKGKISDVHGIVYFTDIHTGSIIHFSSVGYQPVNFAVTATADSAYKILMLRKPETGEEVIVSSSRTESRIENLPTKVEVLGTEEVEEESGIKPGNIGSLLGDLAGIQAQQTSAVTGNIEMRVQGLPGEYTQLLRDGMPLFGDFAGGFSIMQIPPLDLKQVEIIKGPSSTLYGGGAIAGIINMVSKKPRLGVNERSVLLNITSLGEINVNLYGSKRDEKNGFSVFAGANLQKPVDVNKDGYADLPGTKTFFAHPVFYYYPSNTKTFSFGYNLAAETRKGGDMHAITKNADSIHRFFIDNNSSRHTVDLQWENRISSARIFTIKSIGSFFNRDINTNTYTNGKIKASQLSYYSEVSYLIKSKKNDIVAGINFNGQNFNDRSDVKYFKSGNAQTIGLFAQDDWRLFEKTTIETGLRLDHNSRYGSFLLPRVSVLYKINPFFTTRLGGGLGYRAPTVFDGTIDERDYPDLYPAYTKAERSYGSNWDINYHKRMSEDLDVTINQSFYTTYINYPVIITDSANRFVFINSSKPLFTKGIETYVQVNADPVELYFGYTLTDAIRRYNPAHPHVPLSAQNKFAAVLAYEFSGHFRAGIEASVTGRQYLDDGSRTPAWLFTAAMVRYDISKLSIVFNCENLLDYRQSRKGSLIESGSIQNPVFKEIWAPIDGRAVNVSAKIRL